MRMMDPSSPERARLPWLTVMADKRSAVSDWRGAEELTREDMAERDDRVARLVKMIDAGDPRLDLTIPDPEDILESALHEGERICAYCAKTFEVSPNHRHSRFCPGGSCRGAAWKMANRKKHREQTARAKRRHRVKARKEEESK